MRMVKRSAGIGHVGRIKVVKHGTSTPLDNFRVLCYGLVASVSTSTASLESAELAERR
jgi:hypothetical protein